MERLFRWLRGYINVRLYGHQINRFINLCSRNGIHLWNISHDLKHIIRVNFHLRDFYLLKPFLRKTKTKIRIMSRHGFPFWCHRHPKLRWFLCICICLLSLGIYSLNFVWMFDVKGNSKLSSYEIIDYLIENDINIGQKKETIDCSKIETLLRENFHQLSWVSVYLEHTKLCIEIKESLYDVAEYLDTEFGLQYDLIANKDAQIYSIVTRAGKSLVKDGQYVKQGDILVIGQNDIYDDTGALKDTLVFKAQAQILGDVIYEVEIPFSEIEILSMKIADMYSEKVLLQKGYLKLDTYLNQLCSQGVIILDIDGMIDSKEKYICFKAKIYAREQIGINIPVEEVIENEFE